jgi:hypothetical protein
LRVAYFAATAALLALAIFSEMPNAYSHSMGPFPIRVDAPAYHIQPGETQTQQMRICSMLPSELVVNSVTFNGTNSDWARVDERQFPIIAAPSSSMTASAYIPVTITVPSNFTGDHAIIHTVVNTTSPIPIPVQGDLIVLISNNTATSQILPECNSLIEARATIQYTAIILGSVGAGFVAAGYLVYRYSKTRSRERKANLGAKIFFILIATFGSLLIIGALLSFRL